MTQKESFLEYIKTHAKDNNAIGDFCGDTLRLFKMGKYPLSYTLKEIIDFVSSQHGCAEAIEAAKEAWMDWKSVI